MLTAVSGRNDKLNNLLHGISKQKQPPLEVIVVFINEEPYDDLADPACPLYTYTLSNPGGVALLSTAINEAASYASGELLIFLDANCIPHPDCVKLMVNGIETTNGLISCNIRQLQEDIPEDIWTYDDLRKKSVPERPGKPVSREGNVIHSPYQSFQPLAFGIRAFDFARLGGFKGMSGKQGPEGKDFASMARHARLPHFGSAAMVYHHPPSLQQTPELHRSQHQTDLM